MEVDLDRPPAPLPPRVPAWVILAILWVVAWVVLVLDYYVADERYQPGTLLVPLILLGVLGVATGIAWHLLRSGRSRLFLNRFWTGQAYPQEDPGDPERLADREEVEARRKFRHGEISRGDYERIITRRRFVHGEITTAEYHERITEIGQEEERMAHEPQPRPR